MTATRYYYQNDDPGLGGDIGGGGGSPAPTPAPTPTPGATPPPVATPMPPPNESVLPAIIASSIQGGVSITYLEIPLSPVPAQIVTVQLAEQACTIRIYQKRTGLYLDLAVNGTAIVTGALCRDRTWIIRDAYLGFRGDLAFADSQGLSDPDYASLGARFRLYWGFA